MTSFRRTTYLLSLFVLAFLLILCQTQRVGKTYAGEEKTDSFIGTHWRWIRWEWTRWYRYHKEKEPLDAPVIMGQTFVVFEGAMHLYGEKVKLNYRTLS